MDYQGTTRCTRSGGSPNSAFWGSYPPKKIPSYVVLMSSILEIDISKFEEEDAENLLKYTMIKGYNFGLKINGV